MEQEHFKRDVQDDHTSARSILIVDDEQPILELLRDTLEEEGYVVVTARNGNDALRAALQHRIDLVLTDYMMPQMDGVHLSRQLRAHPQTANVPVIIMSAVNVPDDSSFNKIIRKPFNLVDVLLYVEYYLSSGASPDGGM
jgi:CheY-like chemotaxis protein